MLLSMIKLSGSGPPPTPAPKPGSGFFFVPTPDPNGLPGFHTLQNLANGFEAWALIAAVIGVVIGAVMWAFGHYSQNPQQAYNGRRGVLVSALAALLIGAAPWVIGFLLRQGSTFNVAL